MSIEFSARRRSDPERMYSVSVATHEVFRRYWLPVCAKLELFYVPLFETGLPVAGDDIRDLLNELGMIKSYIASAPKYGVIRERVDQLSDALREAGRNGDFDIYIG